MFCGYSAVDLMRLMCVSVVLAGVTTESGKGRELADMMERRKVDILCVQETRWKGSKARSIGAGFKLFYYGVDSKRNGVGAVLKEEFVRNVLEVKRVSDRVMSLKLEIEGVILNVVSGYAPQVGCELGEKERFWSELDEVMESIPTGERVVIGADFNGHVGEGNRGDEEVMGKFGVKERNLEGQMVVDFAKRMDMAVVNTYFQKREEHRVTYKNGGRRTQVDYILCRRGNLKEISDCKVVVGESVARQHRMVVCRMTLLVCKKKRSKIEIEKKTKWWKLKKEECCEEFRQKLRQALGGQVVLPDDWETTAEVIRETGRKVLGVSSGRRKEDKETLWWNEEAQDSIQRKRLAKKKWDMDRTEENRQEYKELQRRVKSESREQVEENLERWRFALERRGMKVSRSKTEYMCVNEREGSGTVRLQGEEVKKVQEFKYLGSTVQSNGKSGKENPYIINITTEDSWKVTVGYDAACKYTVQVQAKYDTTNCGEGDHDSAMSSPVYFGQDGDPNLPFIVLMIVIPVIVCLCLILAILLFRRHRDKFFPKIPNPSHFFKDMYDNKNEITQDEHILDEDEESCSAKGGRHCRIANALLP
ncbi:hypothetical protein QTP86_019858 [Hemibagrus guttatus]|nr:hypothetical protein QTP86_019858 [Hemibagrus guttatus]